jgi:tryptophan 2,3-dioxygenase
MRTDITANDAIADALDQLKIKYEAADQQLECHLEGLYYTEYTKYWDYIQIDTLLSIQHPKTTIHSEMIFIVYHQITELYFKLIIWELEKITASNAFDPEACVTSIKSINLYYENFINSFEIMFKSMDHEQFLKFRKTLSPASGFQSFQYRLIEILSTSLYNLLAAGYRMSGCAGESIENLYGKIYWKQGAINRDTGKENLSVIHFNQKYDALLLSKLKEYKQKNLWHLCKNYLKHNDTRDLLVTELQKFDKLANVVWPLTHLKSVTKHLKVDSHNVNSTGGTNWAEYLLPRFQKIIYFPELWHEHEREDWGKPEFVQEFNG